MPLNGEIRPDISIIGTDPAGVEIAMGAAALGVPVALIVPGGTELAAADEATLQRLRSLGVQVISGVCRFLDQRRLQVGEVTLKPRRFVLATPSHVIPPQIAGLTDLDTPDIEAGSAFLVLGQDRQALEAACKARQAGAEVALLVQGPFLPDFDLDSVRLLRIALARAGIVVTDAPTFDGGAVIPAAATRRGARRHKLVTADGTASFEFDRLFVEGHTETLPEEIALAKAGILGRDGRLILDKALTTTNRRVLAVGAASGDPDNAANRSAQVGAALANLLFRRASPNFPTLAIRHVASSPAVAEAGLREDDLRPDTRGKHRFYRVRLGDAGHSGAIKVTTDAKGRILGVSILADKPLELLSTFQLAMVQGLRLQDLAGLPLPSVSHAAAIGEIARLALRDRLLSPAVGRLLRFLRMLG